MQKINTASIILTESCNMACKFCYERSKIPAMMSKAMVKDTVDFLADRRNPDKLFLMWFGGEPLLAFDTLKCGLKYAEQVTSHNLTHLITTNGTIWNEEIKDLFMEHQNLNLQISWLGLPELQIQERGGTDAVEKNVKHIIKTIPNRIQIQIQVVPSVVPKLEECLDYIVNIVGDRCKIYIRPVPEAEGWFEEGILKEFETQMDAVCKKYGTVLKIVCDIQDDKTTDKRYCNVGKRLISITPTGDIYPCHRLYFQRNDALKLGNIKTGFVQSAISDMLDVCTRDSMIGCTSCEAHDYCFVCPACNYESTGKFFTPTFQNCAVNKAFVSGLKSVIEKVRSSEKPVEIVRDPNMNVEEALYQVAGTLLHLNGSVMTLFDQVRKMEEQIKFLGRM